MKLVILSGLPRSGKSTLVKERFSDYVVISRDLLREELFGNKNNMEHEAIITFEFDYRLEQALLNKVNVVIDNTNLKVKYVEPFIKLGKQYGYDIEIIRLFVNPLTLWERARETNFPIEVINRMASQNEMWKFYQLGVKITDIRRPAFNDKELRELFKFDQHNKHHQDTLDIHCFKTLVECIKYSEIARLNNEYWSNKYKYTFYLHDVGKIMSVDKSQENWTYKGHERSGWYIGMCYEIMPELILFHMDKFKLREGMKVKKWIKQLFSFWKGNETNFGDFRTFIKAIIELWYADASSHDGADLEWLDQIKTKVMGELSEDKVFC